MAITRTIEQVVPGFPGEYYSTIEASAIGDQLVMAFEGGGNLNDISVEAIGSTNVECGLYVYYPSSTMRNILGTDILPTAGSSWQLNDAASKGKMWYRVPSGTILQLIVTDVTTAGPIDFLAIVR